MKGWRTAAYVLGLAMGSWIGSHGAGRPVELLDWLVFGALLVGSGLVLLTPIGPRSPTYRPRRRGRHG